MRGKGYLMAMNQGGPPGIGAGAGSRVSDPELMETIDGKIERVYERLRNDNWLIWKESIKLAE
jgi:hypothetical protein